MEKASSHKKTKPTRRKGAQRAGAVKRRAHAAGRVSTNAAAGRVTIASPRASRTTQHTDSAAGRVSTNAAAHRAGRTAQRSSTNSNRSVSSPHTPLREKFATINPAVQVILGFLLAAFIMFMLSFCVHKVQARLDDSFPVNVEKWRSTVEVACTDVGVDSKWVDVILAMMQAESSGDVHVSSVVGASQDIMQAAEGCAGVNEGRKNVVELGEDGLAGWGITPSIEVEGESATSSIYAGVIETKQNIDVFEGWLGAIDMDDLGKIGLVAQGYNYGYEGWFAYCKRNGITEWSYDASAAYQEIQPGGTTNHGQKVINFYVDATENKRDAEGAEGSGS